MKKEHIFTDNTKVNSKTLRVLGVLAMVLLVAGVSYQLYKANITPTDSTYNTEENSSSSTTSEQLDENLIDITRSLNSEPATAEKKAEALFVEASDQYAKGRARLVLGLAQFRTNTEQALRTLKTISTDPGYHPLTRAEATWYTVTYYLDTLQHERAKNEIFVGEVWGNFFDQTTPSEQKDLRRASIAALAYAYDLFQTPHVAAQIAYLRAIPLSNSTDNLDEQVTAVENGIGSANRLLSLVKNEDQEYYQGVSYVVEVKTLHRIAATLDLMQHKNVGEYSTADVALAYEQALNAAEKYELQTDDEYRVRYHYADFLLRTNSESNTAKIREVLAPMQELSDTSFLAREFQSRFLQKNQSEKVNGVVRPANIYTRDDLAQLAAISDSLSGALATAGVLKSITSTE